MRNNKNDECVTVVCIKTSRKVREMSVKLSLYTPTQFLAKVWTMTVYKDGGHTSTSSHNLEVRQKYPGYKCTFGATSDRGMVLQ